MFTRSLTIMAGRLEFVSSSASSMCVISIVCGFEQTTGVGANVRQIAVPQVFALEAY